MFDAITKTDIVIAIVIVVILCILAIPLIAMYNFLANDAYVYQYLPHSVRNLSTGYMEYSIKVDMRHGEDKTMYSNLSEEKFNELWPKYEKLNEELRLARNQKKE